MTLFFKITTPIFIILKEVVGDKKAILTSCYRLIKISTTEIMEMKHSCLHSHGNEITRWIFQQNNQDINRENISFLDLLLIYSWSSYYWPCETLLPEKSNFLSCMHTHTVKWFYHGPDKSWKVIVLSEVMSLCWCLNSTCLTHESEHLERQWVLLCRIESVEIFLSNAVIELHLGVWSLWQHTESWNYTNFEIYIHLHQSLTTKSHLVNANLVITSGHCEC